jgi:ABC-type bacteriocin/lantibiotic exporter with double-glycine peptidase domain
MKIISQRATLWQKETIGKTQLTIGRFGCTITCLSMLSSVYGPYITPPVLAKKLNFTKDGRILWPSIDKVLGYKFKWRGYGKPKDSKVPLLLEVDHAHWVVGKEKKGDVYVIHDPWDGVETTSSRYAKITGYAEFEFNSIPEPTWIGKLIKKIPVPDWILSRK